MTIKYVTIGRQKCKVVDLPVELREKLGLIDEYENNEVKKTERVRRKTEVQKVQKIKKMSEEEMLERKIYEDIKWFLTGCIKLLKWMLR